MGKSPIWCFTCIHEITDVSGESSGAWVHCNPGDETSCECIGDQIPCVPL